MPCAGARAGFDQRKIVRVVGRLGEAPLELAQRGVAPPRSPRLPLCLKSFNFYSHNQSRY